MKTFDLNGTLRTELGKKATKKVRKEESIPCILYGSGEPIHFMANAKEFGHIVYTPSVYLLNINIEGTIHQAIIQAIQFHPVSDLILHMDFLRVVEGQPVSVSIPVQLEGFAKGVQQGGKLKMEMKRVKIRGEATKLPDALILDVTELEVGLTIKVRDLKYDDFTMLDPKNAVIVSLKTTRAVKGAVGTEEAPAAVAAPAAKK
ncbi:MAG: 50S ribosomal protein L25/general stress protein Ctc [Bacteroidetes bacterium GWF2_49_14]|nr:MAG: 50S ribosomal protein L25/general stress protein Ctc [Bacteroidetes bacterium GWF2_49_14]HBB93348.1 50S ribosomal protein L25 [Bacteroidales bacterium]